ncbi:MAG TPA: hypothetical protein VIH42_00345 [Thermoguttaceae bacterium]
MWKLKLLPYIKQSILIVSTLIFCSSVGLAAEEKATAASENTAAVTAPVKLPQWQTPPNVESISFSLSPGGVGFQIWGGPKPDLRLFFEELLPACFERTLEIDQLKGTAALQWILTGPRRSAAGYCRHTERSSSANGKMA